MLQKGGVDPVGTAEIHDLRRPSVRIQLFQQCGEHAAPVLGRLVTQLAQGVEVTPWVLQIVDVVETRLNPHAMPRIRTAHYSANLPNRKTRTRNSLHKYSLYAISCAYNV